MKLEAARELFPSARRWTWFNHASMGPLSVRSAQRIERAVSALTNPETMGDKYEVDIQRLRECLTQLVGGKPEEIAITRGTAHGLSLIAHGLDWRAGDNVVGAHLEFPTNLYPWMNLSSRGVEFRRVSPTDGRLTAESVFDLIDERTRVVALSLVQFWNGYRLDVETIGAECRRRGVLLVLDAVQGVGALRINVATQPIDALAAGTSKWLLGGPGAGFAWIRPDLIERLDPPLIGTRSTTKPQEYFEPELNLWPTGRRFEESDLNWPLVASFLGGAELLAEVGIGKVEERVLENSERLAAGLSDLGFEIVEPWPRTRSESSGIISFRSPGEDPEELMRYLEESLVKAQLRRDFIRFSPHFYNNTEDVDRALAVLASRPVRSAAGR